MPVGGTGGHPSQQRRAHAGLGAICHTPATDASGITKAVMDDLFEYFQRDDLPNKLRRRHYVLPEHAAPPM